MAEMKDVFCVDGEWFWIPLECEILNPEKLQGIGPFSSEEEARRAGEDNCWAVVDAEFKS
jgi:hypothetical protein